jgi:hypothetical protein
MTDEQRLHMITDQLILVRDNLFRGMSKSIQKLQARSINEVLELETFIRSAPDLQAELDATNRQVEILSDALAESQREVDALVAGALFDFMGWLTSRDQRLTLSSTDEASPAVEAITEFAKMRGLLLVDARVQDWQDTAPPAAQRQWVGLDDDDISALGLSIAKARALESLLKRRNT